MQCQSVDFGEVVPSFHGVNRKKYNTWIDGEKKGEWGYDRGGHVSRKFEVNFIASLRDRGY